MWTLLYKWPEQCCMNCFHVLCQAVLQMLAIVQQLLESISLGMNSLGVTHSII